MASPRFSLTLFGAPRLRDQLTGRAIALPAKAFELAAYLILAEGNAPARRETVAQLLWEHSERGRAIVNLRALLARVRRIGAQAGFELLVTTREHLWLKSSVADIVRLRALASDGSASSILEQCALYRGDLLDGVAASGEWLAPHRAALRNEFVSSLAGFLDGADPRADGPAIESAAVKLLAADPYQEAAYCALMRLHAAAGRLRDLERVYRECHERFELELATSPGRAVTELYRSLCGLAPDEQERAASAAPRVPAASIQATLAARPATGTPAPSICVLAPALRPGGTADLLIAALLEDVTIGLCAQRTFAVIAPHTAWQLGSDGPQDALAEVFGIGYLMQTRLQELGGERLLIAKLIDARLRRIIWADRFALDIDDLGPAYRRLQRRIVRSLADAIENAELDRHRRQPAASAYVAYLLGARALAKVQLPDVRAARSLFKTSLQQDDAFAPAFGGVARTLVMEWLLLARGDTRLLEDAERYARRALALDHEQADGLRELGLCHLYRGRFDESLQAFAEAEERAPQHADLIADHADALSLSGMSSQALAKITQATVLNPLCPDRYRWYEGTILYQLDRYEEAIRAVSRMADNTPAFKLLAASWAMLGEPAKARNYARKVMQTYPDFTVAKWLAMIPIRDAGLKDRYEQGLRAAGFR